MNNMENDRHHHGSGFFNGLILGLLIGAGLVFLFGTTKGRKVLQMLLEQVEENTQLSELLEMPDDEDEEYMMGVEEANEEEPKEEKSKVVEEENAAGEIKSHKAVARVKRFFKGSSKKLVS